MKFKETVLNLMKVSLILVTTLFNIQAMAVPPVTADDTEGHEQVGEIEVIKGDDTASEDSASGDNIKSNDNLDSNKD